MGWKLVIDYRLDTANLLSVHDKHLVPAPGIRVLQDARATHFAQHDRLLSDFPRH